MNPDRGRAELEVTLVCNASTVTGVYAANPMKLFAPRSRGPSVWTYTSSFGGGLVAGDQTRLDLRIGKGARCFVGTQSATKIYRNPDRRPCSHVTRAVLEEGSFLAFMPAPVQPFADSRYSQRQTFHLAPGAGLVLLDWFTAGRTACGERWAFAHFSSRDEVFATSDRADSRFCRSRRKEALIRTGRNTEPPHVGAYGSGASLSQPCETEPARPATPGPAPAQRVFLDSLRLDAAGDSLLSPHRTGRFNCFATLLLLGAPLRQAVALMLAAVGGRPVQRRPCLLVSASPVGNGAVLRVGAERVETAEAALQEHLGFLSGWLGDLPWTRRW
jgi:urease accessory protein